MILRPLHTLSSLERSRVLLLPLLLVAGAAVAYSLDVDVLLPKTAEATENSTYVCTALKLPDKTYKLVGVEALSEQQTVDQILVYGCRGPLVRPLPKQPPLWDCRAQPVCDGEEPTMLYGWGRGVPSLQFPPGIGFAVGNGTDLLWAVVQVHYTAPGPAAEGTGARLKLANELLPFSVGQLSYRSQAQVEPGKHRTLSWNGCCYRGFQPLTTFALRVHTGDMGTMAVVRKAEGSKLFSDHILAAANPKQSQALHALTGQVLWPGDRLAVACEYDSSTITQEGSDVCDVDMFVYSEVPHHETCFNWSTVAEERIPGDMPRAAHFLPDPFPLWNPPQQETVLKISKLGDAASVAVGPDGTLWVLHRGGRSWGPMAFDDDAKYLFHDPIPGDVVVQMHPDTGKVLRHWGGGQFYLPHMISVDRNNNVYITDVGRHQMLKFTASGQKLLEAGLFDQPGGQISRFCQPADVAVLSDGSILVADGHCNSRIVSYYPNGTEHNIYILPNANGTYDAKDQPWGTGIGVAHSLVVDECDGEVMLADRDNKRVHVFDIRTRMLNRTLGLGKFGKIWALAKGPYGRTLALTWEPGTPAVIVDVNQPNFAWELPNSQDLRPHDMAFGPAAMQLAGSNDRLLAVYIAPLCAGCTVQKYVLFPGNYVVPDMDAIATAALHLHEINITQHAMQNLVLPTAQRAVLPASEQDSQQHSGPTWQNSKSEAFAGLHGAAAGGYTLMTQNSSNVPSDADVQYEQEHESEDEALKMGDPSLYMQLKRALEVMQQRLGEQNSNGAAQGAEGYITLQSAGLGIKKRLTMATILIVLGFSAIIGAIVGAVAAHVLSKLGLRGSSSAEPGGTKARAGKNTVMVYTNGLGVEQQRLLHIA